MPAFCYGVNVGRRDRSADDCNGPIEQEGEGHRTALELDELDSNTLAGKVAFILGYIDRPE